MIGILAKILFAAGAAGAATWLAQRGKKLTDLQNVSDKMESTYAAMIHKITLQGIVIRVDVNFKNPSTHEVKMKFPFVKLIYKNATIGTSQVVNKDITVPAYGESVAEGIMITIQSKGIFSIGAGLIKSLTSGEAVKIKITASTLIDMGNQKPYSYEDTKEVTLLKEQPKEKPAESAA